jgi:hypothetical protein
MLELTRRCPLGCRHCSTSSLPSSDQLPGDPLIRLVRSFTPHDHPRVMVLSGGEPLLRPRLVRLVAELARAAGTRSYLLSGGFFARTASIPAGILAAIASVDHFAVSLDAFHEEQVPRARVLDVVGRVLASGTDASVQVAGMDDGDPYLAGVTAEVVRRFGGRVPVLTGRVSPVGRAAEWMAAAGPAPRPAWPAPCTMAAWPAVTAAGTVVACCNQRVLDGPVPAHLLLGHAAVDGWPVIRDRLRASPALRALRSHGPWRLAERPAGPAACGGYCETCRDLGGTPGLTERASALMATGEALALEAGIAGWDARRAARTFVRRYGVGRYAELAFLGCAPGP